VPDYQRVGETVHDGSYRSELGSEGAAYHPGEEVAGYAAPGDQESDSMSARFASDGAGIPLDWEDD
jgi:hypothetical protein